MSPRLSHTTMRETQVVSRWRGAGEIHRLHQMDAKFSWLTAKRIKFYQLRPPSRAASGITPFPSALISTWGPPLRRKVEGKKAKGKWAPIGTGARGTRSWRVGSWATGLLRYVYGFSVCSAYDNEWQ